MEGAKRLPVAALLAIFLVLGSAGCVAISTPSASTSGDILHATEVRQSLGLRADAAWVLTVANDPTAVEREGIKVTAAEAVELDERRFRKEIALRTQLGLSDDPAWVRAILANPNSVIRNVGFPILMAPEEAAEWDRRVASESDVRAALDEYAASHSDEWGGWYISEDSPGAVALVTRNLEDHRAALKALIGTQALPIEVRQVTWTFAQLAAFRDDVFADEEWFDEHGLLLTEASENKPSNRVRVVVEIPSPDLNATTIDSVFEHFGSTEWMTVSTEVDPYTWLGAGSLIVTVVDQFGRPVPNMTCRLFPAVEGGAANNTIVNSDTDGRCDWSETGLAATSFRVEVRQSLDSPLLGAAQAAVKPKEETSISISIAVQ